MRCSNIGPRGARNWFSVLDSPRQLLSPCHPDVLRSFRRRSPADSPVGPSAPPGSHTTPPARGGGAPMGVGNRSKEEVRGESLLGSYDIHAGGVAKPAQELFAVLPRQTERPHVGHPQARDHIANVVEVRLFERPFHHRRFCPGDKSRTREVMTQVCGELIRYHLTSDFTHYI